MALTAPQFSRPVNWVIIQYRSRTKLEDVMFFKRQQTQFSNWGSLREIAWDDKTVEWIAQSDRLDMRVTHIQKIVSVGQSIYGGKDSSECSVHGVMTFPKFIPVSITFADDERFGAFFTTGGIITTSMVAKSICHPWAFGCRIEMERKQNCCMPRCVTQL